MPGPAEAARRSPLLSLTVALLTGVLLLSVLLASSERVGRPFPGFLLWDNGYLVALHRADWPSVEAGMPLNGGRILEVEGEPFPGGKELWERATSLRLGTALTYRVEREGARQEIAVPTVLFTWRDYLPTIGNYLINAAFCFAIAALVLFLRPELASARALALVMVLLGCALVGAVDLSATYRIPFAHLPESLTPAGIIAFLLIFPVPRFSPRTRTLVIAGSFAAAFAMDLAKQQTFASDPALYRTLTDASILGIALTGVATVASLGIATGTAPTVRARVQAALVFGGALVAFLVPSMLILAFEVLDWSFSFGWVTAFLFFFPISVLYAIVRHELFDAERFIRITVGYAVSTSALVLGYAAALTLLERLTTPRLATGPGTSFAALIVFALAFDPLRRVVQRALDRGFYRVVTNPGRVLEEAGLELAELLDEPAIRRVVAHELGEALGLEWAEVRDQPEPVATICEPVAFRGEQLGFLLGGGKRSGAPLAASDRELARGLAAQAALAIRNARSFQTLRETQEALLRAERLAVVGEFAGAVAHGVRNPLSSIRAGTQIARELTRDPELREALEAVLSEADRLDQRIRGFLEFSRPFEPSLAPVDLGEVLSSVRGALANTAERQGVEFGMDVEPAGLTLSTDMDYLEEALLELGGNALRSMPEGGRLVISAEAVEGSWVRIRVEDSGKGIPSAVRDHVFDLFFTTRPDGTGVGLASVRKIIERLGGRVRLVSSGPEGTVFEIDLPIGDVAHLGAPEA